MAGSAFAGVGIGLLRRWGASGGDYARWVYAYALYILAFFMYENVLSFSVAPVWDCIVTGVAMAVVSGRLLGGRHGSPSPSLMWSK